jgi:hypothetical protein
MLVACCGTQQYAEQINCQMHQSDGDRIRDRLLPKQGNNMWIKIIHLPEPAQKGTETNLLKKEKN